MWPASTSPPRTVRTTASRRQPALRERAKGSMPARVYPRGGVARTREEGRCGRTFEVKDRSAADGLSNAPDVLVEMAEQRALDHVLGGHGRHAGEHGGALREVAIRKPSHDRR